MSSKPKYDSLESWLKAHAWVENGPLEFGTIRILNGRDYQKEYPPDDEKLSRIEKKLDVLIGHFNVWTIENGVWRRP